MNNEMLCFWLVFSLSYVFTQDPVANLPQGRIVGIKVYAKNSLTPVEIYFGIPYATSPTGRYRFSAPERHLGWKRTFFAHRMPPQCPQIDGGENNYISEDCLFLNIWTPRNGNENLLPVVVIFYNESWLRGGVPLPCEEFASEGVVVVVVNYRLHVLSFFTLRSVSARGNLALLDQYLALVWIHENIAAFGGDPASVTLLGHSAGADSVLYHIVSNRAVGLFQRAILMSPQELWKVIDETTTLNATTVEHVSREMAESLGCTSSSDEEILLCMRARSLTDIMSLYKNNVWAKSMQPVPDVFLPESEQYLPTSLLHALSKTKQIQLDLLLGSTDLDYINDNDESYRELAKRNASFIDNYANTKAIPQLLRTFSLDREETLLMLVKAVRWEYWNDNTAPIDKKAYVLESLARTETSAKWGAGISLLAARLARRVSKLYVYSFSEPGVDLNGIKHNYSGAVHGTDLVSLLGNAIMLQISRRPSTLEEKRLTSTYRQYIVNFIKFGSPGREEWQRYRAGDAHIYNIVDVNTKSDKNEAAKKASFWLQYLPQLSDAMSSCVHTAQLTLGKVTCSIYNIQGTFPPCGIAVGRPIKKILNLWDALYNIINASESRLRGGVFALCGVTVVFLLILGVSAILLRRKHARRLSIVMDDVQPTSLKR